jgi:hypothetical protein
MADPIPTGTIGQSPVFALPREGATASATGFQGAHMFGKDFVGQEGAWLKRLFPGAGAADATWPWNFAQLGETKGTAAANGTSGSCRTGCTRIRCAALRYERREDSNIEYFGDEVRRSQCQR